MPPSDDRPPGRAVVGAAGSQRLKRLLRQHGELVTKVRRKRSAVERLQAEADQVVRAVDERSAAVRAERGEHDDDLHAAFASIVGDLRRPRIDRRAARVLYHWLQQVGAVSARDDRAGDMVTDVDAEPASAPTAAQMRPTFLRLARAYHPDTTTDDALRAHHTELMKELNRAYQGGDVSRLLELERTLDAGATALAPLDAPTLEAQVCALRVQLRELSRAMSALRASYEGALALEHRRLAQAGRADPIGAVVDELRAAAAESRALSDLVTRFRNGDIDVDALLAGPRGPEHADDWLDDVFAHVRDAVYGGPRPRHR